jgi:hypothetical protein
MRHGWSMSLPDSIMRTNVPLRSGTQLACSCARGPRVAVRGDDDGWGPRWRQPHFKHHSLWCPIRDNTGSDDAVSCSVKQLSNFGYDHSIRPTMNIRSKSETEYTWLSTAEASRGQNVTLFLLIPDCFPSWKQGYELF